MGASLSIVAAAVLSVAYVSAQGPTASTSSGSATASSSAISSSVSSAGTSVSETSQTAASSSTQTANGTVDDPLLDEPSLPTLYHETCVTPDYPKDNSTTCASTTSKLGVPENLTMGADFVPYPGGYTETVYEHFFAFVLTTNDTIQFAERGVPYGNNAASVKVYFGGNTSINFTDLRGLVNSGSLKYMTESPGAWETLTADRYSGQLAKGPGVYVFDLDGRGGGGMAYFLVRDESALQDGVKVSIGAPQELGVVFAGSTCAGGPTYESGPREEEFPVTVTANSTTNVDLVSPDVPTGVWVKFVPPVLQGVGPKGAQSMLLLAGDEVPNGGNLYNVSLFVDAFSPSSRLTGESFISLDAAYGLMGILNSPGPLTSPPMSQGIFFDTTSRQNTTTYTPVSEGNQTNYLGISAVYDPASISQGNASSLAVKITGVGLMRNGSETTLPPWIAVKPVNSSFQLVADTPYNLQVCVTISNSPPLGDFTVVLNETVNGQAFSGEFDVQIGTGTFD
jgi:hypothetical protein